MQSFTTQRLTQNQKNQNGKQYYKDMAMLLDTRSTDNILGTGDVSEYMRMKVNYDLYNNKINLDDFSYVCQPYGANGGKMPARMTNKDIVSGKIKAMLGMEMRRPFGYKVMAVNPEATSRKQEAEAKMIRDSVISMIMTPIQQQIELEYQQKSQGQQLTQEQQQQIQQQIQQEVQTRTPDEVRKYMLRDHQDPAEVMGNQILGHLNKKLDMDNIFNKGLLHGLLSGYTVYYSGIRRGNPTSICVNPMRFKFDKSPNNELIEDGDWAVYDMKMTPISIMAEFGHEKEFTNARIDELFQNNNYGTAIFARDATFNFTDEIDDHDAITVRHYEWKALRKMQYLTYLDEETGEEEMMPVDENYTLNEGMGDIKLEIQWIPEKHECYRIVGSDWYFGMRPVVGQHKDLDNLLECKLSYTGVIYDNLNSEVTAVMDRLKQYQYFYNIIWYRIELLLAQNKGKKMVVNMKAIPKSLGISMEKLLYYMDALGIVPLNPTEEGMKGAGDITNMVKEIDMSLLSDIVANMQLAEKVAEQAGNSVGITRQMEAQINTSDAVTNTKQAIIQASYILQPYYSLHARGKRNHLQSLLECAKVAYAVGKPRTLVYTLDDMSNMILQIDQELLDNSTLNLFMEDDMKANEAKELVQQLAHAAMQNAAIDLSDVIKVANSDSAIEAQEILEVAEQKKATQNQQNQLQSIQMQNEDKEKDRNWEREKMAFDRETKLLVIKETHDAKMEEDAVVAEGFAKERDEDHDGQLDLLEIAKHGVDANIKMRKQNLDENKFDHQQKVDTENINIKKQALRQKSSAK